ARQKCCSSSIRLNAAEKSFLELRLYFNDLVRAHTVTFAMYLDGGFRVWRVAKTKNLPGLFIHPVSVVTNAVLVLEFNIFGVSFGDILGTDASRDLVNVHV